MKQRKTKTFLGWTTILSLFPFLAWAHGEESCPFMNGWGMGHGVIGFWFWSLFLVLIILVLFLVLKDKGKS